MATLARGEKKKITEQAIRTLGFDATFASVKKWIKARHNCDIHESKFYPIRREMQAKHKPPTASIGSTVHKAVLERMAEVGVVKPAEQPSNSIQARAYLFEPNGIIALVKTAKALVEKLGKEEAKSLIDAL
jgi:hypothetical protein